MVRLRSRSRTSLTSTLASSMAVGHGDVEVLNARGDVGHDLRELRLAVGAGAVGEHPHRRVVFADAVDAAGEMIFGAERGLQKAFDDLAVGEDLLLGALALRDRGNFGGGRRAATRIRRARRRPERLRASIGRKSAGRAHSRRRCSNRRVRARLDQALDRRACAAPGSGRRRASSSRSPWCRPETRL